MLSIWAITWRALGSTPIWVRESSVSFRVPEPYSRRIKGSFFSRSKGKSPPNARNFSELGVTTSQLIVGKGLEDALVFFHGRAHDADLRIHVDGVVGHFPAVVLLEGEEQVGVVFGHAGQQLRQQILGGDGGSGDLQRAPDIRGTAFDRQDRLVPHLQHLAGATRKRLLPALEGLDFFGGADDEFCAKFVFQCADVGADGGLGKVDLFRRFGKTFELDDVYKGFQLFKMHDDAILSRALFCRGWTLANKSLMRYDR